MALAAVAELAVEVVAPTLHRAVEKHGARVVELGLSLHGIRDPDHRHRSARIRRRPVSRADQTRYDPNTAERHRDPRCMSSRHPGSLGPGFDGGGTGALVTDAVGRGGDVAGVNRRARWSRWRSAVFGS